MDRLLCAWEIIAKLQQKNVDFGSLHSDEQKTLDALHVESAALINNLGNSDRVETIELRKAA